MCIYTYIYMYIYTLQYIYIHRERERESRLMKCVCVYRVLDPLLSGPAQKGWRVCVYACMQFVICWRANGIRATPPALIPAEPQHAST